MRGTYGLIFAGFAVVGFSSVFNAHKPASNPPRSTNLSAAHPLSSPLAVVTPSSNTNSAIDVETELIAPEIIEVDDPPSAARTSRHAAPHVRPRPRSLLARVVLGDGQYRPQPFPTPGTALK